mmetsp:Transcript_47266/g.75486  ORF Transcript_47266/g.75486 Transcript_47266/m.75486 type:complete len:381 (+) Transcript_47266:59-1201(+)
MRSHDIRRDRRASPCDHGGLRGRLMSLARLGARRSVSASISRDENSEPASARTQGTPQRSSTFASRFVNFGSFGHRQIGASPRQQIAEVETQQTAAAHDAPIPREASQIRNHTQENRVPAAGTAEAHRPHRRPLRRWPPPASTYAISSLPHVMVTLRDIEQNQNDSCVVCLDTLAVGNRASRVPCGHLFHEACILDWLKNSNQCPVCRYELSTDDAEYELLRKERMASRKLRLRMSDLQAKSVHELMRLAQHLHVASFVVIGKQELIDKISACDGVEIVPESAKHGSFKLPGSAITKEDIAQRLAEFNHSASDSRTGSPRGSGSVTNLAGHIMAELRETAANLGITLSGLQGERESTTPRTCLSTVGQSIIHRSLSVGGG